MRRADLIAGYVRTAPVVLEPFTNPPGYNSVGANVAMLKASPKKRGFVQDSKGSAIDHTQATVEQIMDADTVFAGTPDDVYNQIKAFNDRIGGFGHLLFFGQGGFLDHKDTMDNIRLFGSELMPRLRELSPETKRTTSAAVE